MKRIFPAAGRKTVLLLAALAAAVAGGTYFFQDEILMTLAGKEIPEKDITPALPRPNPRRLIEDAVRTPVPPSPWAEAEKKRYLALLAVAKPAVLVLPFQIPQGSNQFGIDLPARMVMAYATAQRIASGTELKVADVELAARAFGEPRHATREDARALGIAAGASTVVFGEAAHDGAGHLAVTITSLQLGASQTPDKSWSKTGLDISDVITPELAYLNAADEAVAGLGFAGKALETKPYVASARPLPESPGSAANDFSGNPADGLWIQEFIGAVYPDYPSRARDRIFERALAGTEYLSADAPDYRLLKARALARLGRRLAALSILGNPVTAEEQAFLGFLNGNAPDMQKAVAQIKRPLPRLIAELDLIMVEAYYGTDNNRLPQIAERIARTAPKNWAPGIIWYVTGLNTWNLSQTMPVKLVMDAHFPVKGYGASDVMQGKAVMGVADLKATLEIEGAPLVHAGKVLEQSGADWCCEAQAWKPRPFQYLNLLAAHAESMLIRNVDHIGHVQGKYDEATQLADMMDDTIFLHGNFMLQLRRVRFLNAALARTPSQDGKAALVEPVYQAARKLRQWNNAYPDFSPEIAEYEAGVGRQHFAELFKQAFGVLYPQTDEFRRDFPPNYEALTSTVEYRQAKDGAGKDFRILETTCLYSMIYLPACEDWRARLDIEGQTEAARKVEKEQLVERFRGNPDRAAALTMALRKRGEIDEAAALARESVKLKRDDWQGYNALGGIYLDGGKFKEAADAFLSYPAFKNPGTQNTVGLSNAAGMAGYELSRRGANKEARPLFELAARYSNGAESSLYSMLSLALADQHYGDAELVARGRMQRYGEGKTVRAYLSLLFALGDSQDAWAGVAESLPRVGGFSQWRAVPVGFRLDGADAGAVRKWAKENSATENPRMPAELNEKALKSMTVAFQSLAMDRLAAAMEALPEISRELFPEPAPPAPSYDGMTPEQRDAIKKSMDTARATIVKEKRERTGYWKDYLDRMVAGYPALKRADYKAAWEAFEVHRALTIYDHAFDASYTALPYHAYAAAKTGQAEAFAAYLEKSVVRQPLAPQGKAPPPFPAFDAHLARAVLAAAKGDHDDAKKQLMLARATVAEPGSRPLPPEYVFAEVCEMLATDSGKRDYLDIAVAWAKAYQVYEPWAAWAYAFEAKYGTNDAERVRALAYTLYLDRNSARIAGLDAGLVSKAKAWLAANKPFPRNRRAQQKAA